MRTVRGIPDAGVLGGCAHFACPVRGRGGGSRTGVSLFFRNTLSKWLGLPERLYALTERILDKRQV